MTDQQQGVLHLAASTVRHHREGSNALRRTRRGTRRGTHNNAISEHALVTVVIPSYNPGNYLNEAIESVLRQTYKNWRMIIVDDASTDGSVDRIRRYLKDPRITLVKNRRNIGQTKSLNVGLRHVKTPFMVQLDSDDWFLPNTLDVLVKEALHTKPNVALVSGNIKVVWSGQTAQQPKSFIRRGKPFKDKYQFILANRSCWPRFYRTSALRAVGGWPTAGPYEGRYIEDLRILFRLIPRYRFHWVDRVLYVHRKHDHNMTRRTKEMKDTLYWLIDDTLLKWGGKYRPQYRYLKNGYPQLKSLVPKASHEKTRRLAKS